MRALAILALALMAVLAGCGGDSEESGGELSKAEVISRGDELCRRYRDSAAPITDRAGSSGDPKEVGEALRELAREADGTAVSFVKLTARAPESDRIVLRRYARRSREQIVLLRGAADLLDAGRTAQAGVLIRSGRQSAEEVRRIARGYGFKVCGTRTG